jgi:hypothetical protein
MQEEYNFAGAEKGKFYKKDVKLNVPVYLDHEVLDFVGRIAEKKKQDISSVVNQLIHSDMELMQIAD